MDETTVKNLANKYIDCVKLLVNEPFSDDVPDVLDDLIYNTKLFTDEMKYRKRQRDIKKSNRRNVTKQRGLYERRDGAAKNVTSTVTLKSFKYQELQPVVRIRRLNVKNVIETNVGGIEVMNTNKKSKSTALDDGKFQLLSEKEVKTEIDDENREEIDDNKGECKGNLNDGCVIN